MNLTDPYLPLSKRNSRSLRFMRGQPSVTILPATWVRLRMVRPRQMVGDGQASEVVHFSISYKGLATPSTSSVVGDFRDFPTHDFSEFCGLSHATFFARRLAGKATNASHSSSVEAPVSHAA